MSYCHICLHIQCADCTVFLLKGNIVIKSALILSHIFVAMMKEEEQKKKQNHMETDR